MKIERNIFRFSAVMAVLMLIFSFVAADFADARSTASKQKAANRPAKVSVQPKTNPVWGNKNVIQSQPNTQANLSLKPIWGTKQQSVAPTKSLDTTATVKPQQQNWGKNQEAVAVKPMGSKTDQALYEKAKMQGTAFKSRDEATKSFQQKYPTTFTKEPSARPNYIPRTANVNGGNVNIIYNSQYGGYGYFDPITHSWTNAMANAIILNAMMHNHGYRYGAPPVVADNYVEPASGAVIVQKESNSGVSFFFWILGLSLLGVVAIVVYKALKKN